MLQRNTKTKTQRKTAAHVGSNGIRDAISGPVPPRHGASRAPHVVPGVGNPGSFLPNKMKIAAVSASVGAHVAAPGIAQAGVPSTVRRLGSSGSYDRTPPLSSERHESACRGKRGVTASALAGHRGCGDASRCSTKRAPAAQKNSSCGSGRSARRRTFRAPVSWCLCRKESVPRSARAGRNPEDRRRRRGTTATPT